MPSEAGVAAKGFMSYVRRDNEVHNGVVDELKRVLEGRFHAATGRELEIFVDRDSIGWGADWRASIRESVQTATFFIPVITMRYFESEACREELLAFHEYASELGVEALILPIVLAGADEISADDPREEVRLIERLNYKNVEEAWLAGYGSSEWLRAIHSMVQELKQKLALAEAALTSREFASASVPARRREDPDASDGETADVFALGEDVGALTPAAERVQAAIEALGRAASHLNDIDFASVPPAQRQATLVRVAHDMAAPAAEVAESGSNLERLVLRADSRLRAVTEELRTIDAELARQQLDSLLGGMAGLRDIAPVVGQLDRLVEVLRFAAMTNVSMRKSVQPAIQGLQSISNAIDTVRSWNSL